MELRPRYTQGLTLFPHAEFGMKMTFNNCSLLSINIHELKCSMWGISWQSAATATAESSNCCPICTNYLPVIKSGNRTPRNLWPKFNNVPFFACCWLKYYILCENVSINLKLYASSIAFTIYRIRENKQGTREYKKPEEIYFMLIVFAKNSICTNFLNEFPYGSSTKIAYACRVLVFETLKELTDCDAFTSNVFMHMRFYRQLYI